MITYGYTVKEHDDPLVDAVEASMKGFSECMEPGAFLVDVMPFCKSPFLRWRAGVGIYCISLQCDTCPIGSLGQDGKRRPRSMRGY